MEGIQARNLLVDMEKICNWRLRELLDFHDVQQITDVILKLPEEATEKYIRDYVGQNANNNILRAFLTQLLPMKRQYKQLIEQDKRNVRVVDDTVGDNIQIYRKKDFREYQTQSSKKKKQKREKKQEKQQRQANNNEIAFIRAWCDCQASEHALVRNCLSCGRIICAKEGEGECLFCGALMYEEFLESQFLDDNADRATAHRDRLLNFEQKSVGTKIYDDQADYFDYRGNQWLSAQEKEIIKQKVEELQAKKEEEKRKIRITIDLAGRQVVEQESKSFNNLENEIEEAASGANYLTNKTGITAAEVEAVQKESGRSYLNPFLSTPAPRFLLPKQDNKRSRKNNNKNK